MHRRITLALTIFVIVIIILIPWSVGFIFKQRYYHFIDLLNNESGIKIEILQYQEGWLNSHAKIRISFLTNVLTNLPDINLTAPVSFIVDENIIHGPVIIDIEHAQIQSGYAKINSSVLVNQPETNMPVTFTSSGDIKISTISEMDGDWKGAIHIPGITAAMDASTRLKCSGMNGDFKVIIRDDKIRHVLVNAHLGAMTLTSLTQQSPVRQVDIEPIDYFYNSIHDKLGLWSGTTSMTTSGLDVQISNGSHYIINGLGINSKFGVSGVTFYNTTVGINADMIKTPSQILPVISALHISLSADNFSAEGMQKYINFFRNKTPEAVKKVDLKTAENLMVHTIMPTSMLYSDTSMNTSLGSLYLHTKSIWKVDAPPPVTLSDISANSETEIDLKVSDAIMRQVITLYNEKKKNTSAAQNVTPVAQEKTSNTLDQQLAQLLQQEKISVSGFVQILNMEKQNYSVGKFAENLDRLALPADITNQLKQAYQAQMANTIAKQRKQMVIDWSAPETLIHNMLMIGYITEENNNYLATLTIENGEIKVGGTIPDEVP